VKTPRISFTGTHLGMTGRQKSLVKMHLQDHFMCVGLFIHGDCIGADAQAAEIARQIGYETYVYPPVNEYHRAFTNYDYIAEPDKYLDRDKEIVELGDVLIVAPHTNYEIIRSGTWATYRYAKSIDKPTILVYPFEVIKEGQ
jgi:hypothetical protein